MRKLNEMRAAVRDRRPLIHCITNPISINQCANAVLAAGARPIMAEHPAEVKEITESADALVLNLGNITDVRMESMEIALRAAKEKGIPVVLDAVGTACSGLRRVFAARLLATAKPAVLKGNYSEIYALYRTAYRSAGVDADAALGEDEVREAAGELAGKYGITVLASGNPGMEAAAAACAMLGCCGQIAETEKGSGTFLVNLLDALSTVTDEQLE